MIDANDLNDNVLSAIQQNKNWSDDELEARVSGMSVNEAFEAFCEWHGLIGWSATLRKALDNIRESYKEKP
jgi:ribulose-5-phosphate 4-epimerase/fuculose-1-phosphate aldolase